MSGLAPEVTEALASPRRSIPGLGSLRRFAYRELRERFRTPMTDEPSRQPLYREATAWVRGAARLLRSANQWPTARALGTGLNRALLVAAGRLLGRRRGVQAVLARHSALSEDFVPWVSDLDLDVVIADRADSLATTEGVWRAFAWCKRCYPLFGELEVQTERELAAWRRWGGLEALEADDWTRLAGRGRVPAASRRDPLRNDVDVAVQAFNLLYWQLYGIVFSPTFDGETFCKVFAKLQRVLDCSATTVDTQLRRSRRSVVAELGRTRPELARCLARIATRRYERIDGDIVEALGAAMHQLLERLPTALPAAPSASLEVVMNHEQPTRQRTLELLEPALCELRAIGGIIDAVLVSGRLGDSGATGNYDYKLYLCLADDRASRWAAVLAEVREVFDRHRATWPFNYFGACSLPVLVSRKALQFALRCWDPVEGFEVGMREKRSAEPNPLFVSRSVAYFCNSNRHHRSFAFSRPFTDRIRNDFGAELTLVDYVLTLAQLRLALEHGTLPITTRDVVDEYRRRLPGRTDLGAELEQWHHRYGALGPAEMGRVLDMRQLVVEAHPMIARQKEAIFRWLATEGAV